MKRERADDAEGFMIIQRFISLWCNQPAVAASTLLAEAARQSAVKVAKTDAAAAAIAREISGLKVASARILYSNEPTGPEGMTAFVAIITSSSLPP